MLSIVPPADTTLVKYALASVVPDGIGLELGVGVGVVVFVGVIVCVGVIDGVTVLVGVILGVGVKLLVGVTVIVGVTLGVGVGVTGVASFWTFIKIPPIQTFPPCLEPGGYIISLIFGCLLGAWYGRNFIYDKYNIGL